MKLAAEAGSLLKIEEEIRRQIKFLKTVLDSLDHPFIIINLKDLTIELANEASKHHLPRGRSACYTLTHNAGACENCGDICPAEIIKRTLKPVTVEHLYKSEDGKTTTIEIHAYPIFDADGNLVQMIEYSFDISERKRMEEELLKNRKFESIGVLAGGIAHDFNNLLSVLIGNITLVKENPAISDKVRKNCLQKAENAALKAAGLSEKLITFSEGGWLKREKIELADLLEHTVREASNTEVVFRLDLPGDLMAVFGDERQLQEVFSNLIRNAREAISTGDEILIEADNMNSSDVYREVTGNQDFETQKQQLYVKISITDRGRGIAKQDLPKIFDPYFTTKKLGEQKGMGLGLTVCYSIIDKHEGYIAVRSEVDSYTTANVYLPAFIPN
ncbi:MAG: hypothetical protein GY765_02170 [bacterium]|nr:hypothetical protein [bacterium]